MKKTKVTCVIPARNEELLIEKTVRATFEYWYGKKNYQFTLIVVNDGSADDTEMILNRLSREYGSELTVLNRKSSGDKGGAVRAGMLAAPKSDIVYFVDADLPFSLEDQFKVATSVNKGQPVVYGSRVESGKMSGNSSLRIVASRILMILNNSMLGIDITDTQCGLKAFRGDIAKSIFINNTIRGFGFDLFTTAYVEKHNIPIEIRQVTLLPEQRPSKVNVVGTSFQMLGNLVTVRRSIRKIDTDKSLTTYSESGL